MGKAILALVETVLLFEVFYNNNSNQLPACY